jgi:hypothetical protein
MNARICPWCHRDYQCPSACTLSLIDKAKVAAGDGWVLIQPGAFVVNMKAEQGS